MTEDPNVVESILVLKGFPLTLKGVGCKDEEKTKGSNNSKDIPRVAMEKNEIMTVKIHVTAPAPVTILVVLESYVYGGKFLAFPDMRIPLCMIHATDVLPGRIHCFEIPLNISDYLLFRVLRCFF